jgi:hypothetical protein
VVVSVGVGVGELVNTGVRVLVDVAVGPTRSQGKVVLPVCMAKFWRSCSQEGFGSFGQS